MEYLAGILIAIGVSATATVVGFDRDRAFYPVVLAVIASYYALFAVMSGSTRVLLGESAVMAVFIVATIVGFRRNLWIVAAALAAHGMFDFFHEHIIPNPGVPPWWPMFCLAYDLAAAAYLASLLLKARVSAHGRPGT